MPTRWPPSRPCAPRSGRCPRTCSRWTNGLRLPRPIGWWWTRARTLAGIDRRWRLHDLRHWSATMAISAGHDVRTVAGRLGHANPAMTLRVYAHAVEAADEAVANSADCSRPTATGEASSAPKRGSAG
ncbi:MAG: tyrosine-type recombinase/integrase [Actinomycetes bacterium]